MFSNFQVYVVDCETTGLQSQLHEIIEVSFYHLNQDRQETWLLKPLKPETIQPEALRVNGHKIENLLHQTEDGKRLYREPSKVIVDIENWMMEDAASPDIRVLVGQNTNYDLNFLQELWNKNNSTETFPLGNRPFILDTRQLQLYIDLVKDEKTEYYNLGSLVQKYGIKKEKAHRAAGDVRMTKDVLLAQLNIFKK